MVLDVQQHMLQVW